MGMTFLLLPVSQSICRVLCRHVQHTWNRKCQHLQKTKAMCTGKGRGSSRSVMLPMAHHVLPGAERTVPVLSLSVNVGDVLPHQQPYKGIASLKKEKKERLDSAPVQLAEE